MNSGPTMWRPHLNWASFLESRACASNFATQIGVSAATTANAARSFAILSAVLPSVEKPTTAIPTAPTTAPHTAGFFRRALVSTPFFSLRLFGVGAPGRVQASLRAQRLSAPADRMG
jgi:hypothetical protein